MKSGDYSVSHDDEFHGAQFSDIEDSAFIQRVFSSRPALVAKETVNGSRHWKDFHGEPYDRALFDLVDGMWDHEHCSVCWFTVTDGFTYWENPKRTKLLCDACYESFVTS